MGCGWLRGVCFSNTTRYDDALDNNNACIRRCQGLVLPDADELKDQTEGFKGKQGKDLLTEAVAELAEDFPAFTAVSELLHLRLVLFEVGETALEGDVFLALGDDGRVVGFGNQLEFGQDV